MKKVFVRWSVAMFLTTACSLPVNAQYWREAPKYHIGVRAGGCLSTEEDAECVKPGFQGGFAGDVKIAKLPFYLESGVYFYTKAANDRYANLITESNACIELPLLLSYHIYTGKHTSIQPFEGGYAAISLTGGYNPEWGIRMGCGVEHKKFYGALGLDYGYRFEHSTSWLCASLFATVGVNF